MGFSYDGDPSASDVAAVRFEIADTDPNAVLLQDGEIAWAILSETGSPPDEDAATMTLAGLYSAAARCMEGLARKFAMQADQVIGDLSTTYSKQSLIYAARAKELRAKAQGMHAPVAPGLSLAARDGMRSDLDRLQPTFRRGQFRNPMTGSLDGPFEPGGDER